MNFNDLSKLMVAYKLSPNEARVVAYLSEHESVTQFELAVVLGKKAKAEENWGAFNNSLRVMIFKIRKKVGNDVIDNLWGMGYRLVPDDKMLEVLK
jgi:DNA-binding response OmpR family regulator